MTNAPATGYQKSAVVKWNQTFIDAVRAGTLGPPMVARAMAIVNTAMYDAWARTTKTALATQSPANRAAFVADAKAQEIAVSMAAYRALVDLYPEQKDRFDNALKGFGLDANDSSQGLANPVALGNLSAALLLGFRQNDGANQKGDLAPGAYSDYTGYAPVNTVVTVSDPTRWQPQKFANGKAPGFLVPHWGKVKAFSLADGSSLRPQISLPAYSSAEYKQNVDYIIGLTAALDDRKKTIAEYWANGPRSETPPGHWNIFAQIVSEKYQYSLEQDVVMYMTLGNAMMDASIVCWDCKRFYDSVRPITAVRSLYSGKTVIGFRGAAAGQGIGPMLGETWSPYQDSNFTTPPFAEFTSGHSTFSAAAARVLALYTGSPNFNHVVTVKAGDETAQFEANVPAAPVTLSWATFADAAREAGFSRLLGGIHFASGNEYGLSSGDKLGQITFDKVQALVAGRA
jgi:hypothetical protein